MVDGIAEWNAAADPGAFSAVLATRAALTIVPEGSIPSGTPSALRGPVVGQVAAFTAYPKWWDLATAAVLVEPDAVSVDAGVWGLDEAVPGRLARVEDGVVEVVRSFDEAALEVAYDEAFGTP